MEWAWVDLDAAMSTMPAEVMKRKKANKTDGKTHGVPLAAQAVAILRDLQLLTWRGR